MVEGIEAIKHVAIRLQTKYWVVKYEAQERVIAAASKVGWKDRTVKK